MAINPIGHSYYFIKNNQINNREQNFGSAKDINLYHIKSKRFHLLPERMKKVVIEELERFPGNYKAEGIRTLYQLHVDTYKELQSAQTLAEAQKMFPEFAGLIDFATVADEFPRLIKVMRAHGLKPEDFSLTFLKKLWFPNKLEDICEEYGFANRTSLNKVLQKINMPRYDKNYTILMQTSEEAGNRAVAEKARRTMTPDMCREYLVLANKANKTPEAREKHAKAMRRFYKDCPGQREKAQEISKLQWEDCPEIKLALSQFLSEQPQPVQIALAKKSKGVRLTEKEKVVAQAFYKRFWVEHPELRAVLGEARAKAAETVNKSWNA